MGTKYKHLTEQDRIFLRIMLEKRYPKKRIASILQVDPSTIYREIKRNSLVHWHSGHRVYWNHSAQESYLKRRKRSLRLEKDKLLREYVHKKLRSGWSPYQIEGRLKAENSGKCIISHETIYHYIYSNYERRNLFYSHLRRKHRLRVRQGSRRPGVPKDLLITLRPDTINHREEFGHWEADLMLFKRGILTNLITLRERKSRYMIIIKNQNKEAAGTALTLINALKTIKEYIKSITFDQGSEFKKYQWIKDYLNVDIYFCEPGSPYQKGAIENGNGVIRTQLPRALNADDLKQRTLNKLAKEINNRPLKCLSYKTAYSHGREHRFA